MPDRSGPVGDEGHGIIPVVTPRYCGGALLIVALASLGGRPDVAVAGQKEKDLLPQHVAILPAQPVWTKMLDTPLSAAGAMDEDRIYVPVDDDGVRA